MLNLCSIYQLSITHVFYMFTAHDSIMVIIVLELLQTKLKNTKFKFFNTCVVQIWIFLNFLLS